MKYVLDLELSLLEGEGRELTSERENTNIVPVAKLDIQFNEDPLEKYKEYPMVGLEEAVRIHKDLKSNRKFITECVSRGEGRGLSLADERLRNYSDFVLECIKVDHRELEHASEALKKDPEFIWRVLNEFKDIAKLPSGMQKSDELIVVLADKIHGNDSPERRLIEELLKNRSDIRNKIYDLNFWLVTVVKNPQYVKAAPTTIKDIHLVWLSAMAKQPGLSQDIPQELCNKDFYLELVKISPDYIVNLTDIELCVELVVSVPECIGSLDEDIIYSRKFWIDLVVKEPRFMDIEAVKNNPEVTKDEPGFYIEILTHNQNLVSSLPEKFSTDENFWIQLMTANLSANQSYISLLPKELSNDQFYLKLIKSNNDIIIPFLEAAKRVLRYDWRWREQFLYKAIGEKPEILNYILERNEAAFVNGVVKKHKANPEVVRVAVQLIGRSIKKAANPIKQNKAIVLLAVKQNGYAMGCKGLYLDNEVVKVALMQNPAAITVLSKRQQGQYQRGIKDAMQESGSDRVLKFMDVGVKAKFFVPQKPSSIDTGNIKNEGKEINLGDQM